MELFLSCSYLGITLLLFAVALTTLCWMVDAWRTPETVALTTFQQLAEPSLSFSLIIPARHEEAVLGRTLDRLAAQRHPDTEVLCVVGHDDQATRQVAEAAANRHRGRIRVVTDEHWPKNKPKALNTALPLCRGEIVGVFDAEDEVPADLLRHVDACFQYSGADVVQGGVQLMNYRSSWWALRNVLEYFFWFRSRLHFHARNQFIPLGGNTVFVRRALLESVGGWDAGCLAEDCDLGVRLSIRGARVAVAYTPEVVTREETPGSIRQLLKQRTRWNQGFLQVLRKGDWRSLPTRRQRLLARYTLSMPFLQAFAGIVMPASLVAIVATKAPVLLCLLTFAPMVPMFTTLLIEAAGLRDFCELYRVPVGPLDYVRLVLGTVAYQMVLSAAAIRAVFREFRGVRTWEKTAHVGAHRVPEPEAAG
jgi:glycosyltransferase XagB